MAVRRWRTGPDTVHQFEQDGQLYEIPFVSRERLLEVVLDGVSFLDRSGGALVITVGRQPTEFPGEALTTGVAVEWRDGPRAKSQPEAPVAIPVPAQPDPQPEPEPILEDEELEDIRAEIVEEDGLEEAAQAVGDDIGDGLDVSSLPDEDLSAIPEGMR